MASRVYDGQNTKFKKAREHDYIFDKLHVVSGERDHNKAARRAAIATAQMTVLPVFDKMFSDMKQYKSVEIAYHPNARLPEHVDTSYAGNAPQHATALIQVGGKDRFRYHAMPKLVSAMPAGASPTRSTPTPRPSAAPAAAHSRGVQTLCRESSAQTVPYQPPIKRLRDCNELPEVLHLSAMDFGCGVGEKEVERVRALRVRRAWDAEESNGRALLQLDERDLRKKEEEVDEMLLRQESILGGHVYTNVDTAASGRLWAKSKEGLQCKLDKIRNRKARDLRKLDANLALEESRIFGRSKKANNFPSKASTLAARPLRIALNPDYLPDITNIDIDKGPKFNNRRRRTTQAVNDKTILEINNSLKDNQFSFVDFEKYRIKRETTAADLVVTYSDTEDDDAEHRGPLSQDSTDAEEDMSDLVQDVLESAMKESDRRELLNIVRRDLEENILDNMAEEMKERMDHEREDAAQQIVDQELENSRYVGLPDSFLTEEEDFLRTVCAVTRRQADDKLLMMMMHGAKRAATITAQNTVTEEFQESGISPKDDAVHSGCRDDHREDFGELEEKQRVDEFIDNVDVEQEEVDNNDLGAEEEGHMSVEKVDGHLEVVKDIQMMVEEIGGFSLLKDLYNFIDEVIEEGVHVLKNRTDRSIVGREDYIVEQDAMKDLHSFIDEVINEGVRMFETRTDHSMDVSEGFDVAEIKDKILVDSIVGEKEEHLSRETINGKDLVASEEMDSRSLAEKVVNGVEQEGFNNIGVLEDMRQLVDELVNDAEHSHQEVVDDVNFTELLGLYSFVDEVIDEGVHVCEAKIDDSMVVRECLGVTDNIDEITDDSIVGKKYENLNQETVDGKDLVTSEEMDSRSLVEEVVNDVEEEGFNNIGVFEDMSQLVDEFVNDAEHSHPEVVYDVNFTELLGLYNFVDEVIDEGMHVCGAIMDDRMIAQECLGVTDNIDEIIDDSIVGKKYEKLNQETVDGKDLITSEEMDIRSLVEEVVNGVEQKGLNNIGVFEDMSQLVYELVNDAEYSNLEVVDDVNFTELLGLYSFVDEVIDEGMHVCEAKIDDSMVVQECLRVTENINVIIDDSIVGKEDSNVTKYIDDILVNNDDETCVEGTSVNTDDSKPFTGGENCNVAERSDAREVVVVANNVDDVKGDVAVAEMFKEFLVEVTQGIQNLSLRGTEEGGAVDSVVIASEISDNNHVDDGDESCTSVEDVLKDICAKITEEIEGVMLGSEGVVENASIESEDGFSKNADRDIITDFNDEVVGIFEELAEGINNLMRVDTSTVKRTALGDLKDEFDKAISSEGMLRDVYNVSRIVTEIIHVNEVIKCDERRVSESDVATVSGVEQDVTLRDDGKAVVDVDFEDNTDEILKSGEVVDNTNKIE